MSNDDDFFGGPPSITWSRPDESGEYRDIPELRGVIRGGRITHVQGKVRATEYGTGTPKTFSKSGDPVFNFVFTVLCDGSTGGALDERYGNPNDDGERRVYVRSPNMRNAIATAFRANGKKGLQVGDEIYLAWTGYGQPKGGKGKAPKTYAAKHVPGIPPTAEWSDGVGEPAGPSQGQGNPFARTGQFTGPQQTAVSAPAAPAEPTWGNGPAQGQPVTTANPAAQQAPAQAPPANPFGGQPAPGQHGGVTVQQPSHNPFA